MLHRAKRRVFGNNFDLVQVNQSDSLRLLVVIDVLAGYRRRAARDRSSVREDAATLSPAPRSLILTTTLR